MEGIIASLRWCRAPCVVRTICCSLDSQHIQHHTTPHRTPAKIWGLYMTEPEAVPEPRPHQRHVPDVLYGEDAKAWWGPSP